VVSKQQRRTLWRRVRSSDRHRQHD
jgi:hypothetical protein